MEEDAIAALDAELKDVESESRVLVMVATRSELANEDEDETNMKKKKRKRQLGLYMAARHHPQRKKTVALSAYSLLLLTKPDPDNPSRTPFLSTETLLTLFAPKRPQLSYPVVRFCFS